VINLLRDLQKRWPAYLFIAHDLAVVTSPTASRDVPGRIVELAGWRGPSLRSAPPLFLTPAPSPSPRSRYHPGF
jgi:hypothetical protein